MRLAEAKIKQGILHAEEEVRLAALRYFSQSFSSDESLMPLVIEAVEKYGRPHAFQMLRSASGLAQTPETVNWLVEELSKEWDISRVEDDNYCFAAALILCGARTDLLRPDMITLRCFPAELAGWLAERLKMVSWDWKAGWDALESLGEEVREHDGFRPADIQRCHRIVESLARYREESPTILRLLQRRYRGQEEDRMGWLEPAIAELAGRMKLEEAVPTLLEWLCEDDLQLENACISAFTRIGGDSVVHVLTEEWDSNEIEFQFTAASVLEDIHTDLAAEKCRQFFVDAEDDDELKEFIADSWLGQFDDEAIEPIRQLLLQPCENEGDDEESMERRDLRYRLVAIASVMGASFPEYDAWHREAVEDKWGWPEDFEPERFRETFDKDEDEWLDDFGFDEVESEDWDDDVVDDEGLDEEENDRYDDIDEGELDDIPDRPVPFKNIIERPGRNDPCPCGSGKKYKKCCMHKDEQS